MILDSDSKKPDIDYPCNWNYKIIGTDVDEMIKVIEAAAEGMEYKISSSNVSSKGKYFSLNLHVFVSSEAIRDIIFVPKFHQHRPFGMLGKLASDSDRA